MGLSWSCHASRFERGHAPGRGRCHGSNVRSLPHLNHDHCRGKIRCGNRACNDSGQPSSDSRQDRLEERFASLKPIHRAGGALGVDSGGARRLRGPLPLRFWARTPLRGCWRTRFRRSKCQRTRPHLRFVPILASARLSWRRFCGPESRSRALRRRSSPHKAQSRSPAEAFEIPKSWSQDLPFVVCSTEIARTRFSNPRSSAESPLCALRGCLGAILGERAAHGSMALGTRIVDLMDEADCSLVSRPKFCPSGAGHVCLRRTYSGSPNRPSIRPGKTDEVHGRPLTAISAEGKAGRSLDA